MSFIVFACIIGRFFMTVEIHLHDCNALLSLFQMCARKYSEADCNMALHIHTGAQLRHNDFRIFADPSRIFTYNCDETFKTTSRNLSKKNARTRIWSK